MRHYSAIICLWLMMAACGKSKTPQPEPPVPPVVVVVPEAAVLSFPQQNGVCVEGSGATAESSTVTFKWAAAKNADSYEVSIKNLTTGKSVSGLSNTTELAMTIARGTPFSWSVVSKNSNGSTAQSSSWKFYNAGVGTVSYPPFPPDELSPALGAFVTPVNGKITLSWKGGDADNDPLTYDVYFGTTAVTEILKRDISAVKIEDISVEPKKRYYWKVMAKDPKGNITESDLVQFSTN